MAKDKFDIQDGVLKSYEGDAEDIVIPEDVTSIASYAIMTRGKTLNSITIPKTVTKIEGHPWRVEPDTIIIADDNPVFTFKDGVLYDEVEHKIVYVHSGLSRIPLREDLLEIESGAFYGFLGVKELSFPSGVKKIGSNAFDLSRSGEVVRVNLPKALEVLGTKAFYVGRYATLEFSVDSLEHWNRLNIGEVGHSYRLLVNGEPVTEIIITKEEGMVSEGAYYNCTSIKSAILEEGITEIGKMAFAQCENLEIISFPDSLESIGKRAFFGCKGLETIHLPKNLKRIEESAFNGCTKLPQSLFLWDLGFRTTSARLKSKSLRKK